MFLFVSDAYEAVNNLTTFFHWFDFINFWRLAFIVSNVDLLILSSLFLAGFGKWQKSLKVTKQCCCHLQTVDWLLLGFVLFSFHPYYTLIWLHQWLGCCIHLSQFGIYLIFYLQKQRAFLTSLMSWYFLLTIA